jgi:hypothetical protein
MKYEVELIDNTGEFRWEYDTREEATKKYLELKKERTFQLALANLSHGDTERWISVEDMP